MLKMVKRSSSKDVRVHVDYSSFDSVGLSSSSNAVSSHSSTPTTISPKQEQEHEQEEGVIKKKTIEIEDLFKHINTIQSKLESVSLVAEDPIISNNYVKQSIDSTSTTTFPMQSIDLTTTTTNINSLSFDTFLSTCNQDLTFLKSVCETNNFQRTLNLYNMLIKLYGHLDMKPKASNAQQMSDEVIKKKSHTHTYNFFFFQDLLIFYQTSVCYQELRIFY